MLENPGMRTLDAGTTPSEFLMSDQGRIDRVGPNRIVAARSIDGANTGRTDEIRSGTLMAKITTTSMWCPMKRTTVLTTGTFTALPVVNASAFQVGDIISVGADASLTVTAINYTTNILTIASTAVVAGEAVIITAADGSETARAILNNTIRLLSGEPFQADLLDKRIMLLIGGYVDVTRIRGDLAAARADTAAKLQQFIWSDFN